MLINQRQTAQAWTRAILLPSPQKVGAWTLAGFITLFAAFCIAKAFRLPALTPDGVFAAEYARLAISAAWRTVWESDLLRAVVFVLFAGLLLARIMPRARGWQSVVVLAAGIYLLLVATALFAHEPNPWLPFALQNVSEDGREFATFFWRDACTAAVASVPLWLMLRPDSRRSRILAGSYVAVLLAATCAATAFFVASRAEPSSAEILYALGSPIDAAKATQDGWTSDLLLPLALPWLGLLPGIAVGLWLARRGTDIHIVRRVALGPWILLTSLACIAAPAVPENPRAERFTDNFLARKFDEIVAHPLLRRLSDSPRALNSLTLPPTPRALQATGTQPRYNVVLILMESMRADAVSSYNPSHDATPRLRELAEQSLQVENMYAVVPRTSAAWIASIAGVYPSSIAGLRYWTKHYPAGAFHSSLARLLQPLGYDTAFFTPTRLDFENDDHVIDALGFQHLVTGHDIPRGSEALNSFGFTDETLLPGLSHWLDARQTSGSPFFLTVMTNSGHYPYGVPRSWHNPFKKGSGQMPAVYLNAVSYTDHYVGQVLDMLRDRGQLDQSLVIVMGDHGEGFLEHGLAWHAGLPYVEGLHVPALIRLPGSQHRGGRITGPRQQIDIAPTVSEVLGLRPSQGTWMGSSLLAEAPADRTLYFGTHFDELNLGMLRGGRRYVYHFGRRDTQIYDVASDPGEQNSLADKVPRGEILAAETQMQDWFEKVRDYYADNRL